MIRRRTSRGSPSQTSSTSPVNPFPASRWQSRSARPRFRRESSSARHSSADCPHIRGEAVIRALMKAHSAEACVVKPIPAGLMHARFRDSADSKRSAAYPSAHRQLALRGLSIPSSAERQNLVPIRQRLAETRTSDSSPARDTTRHPRAKLMSSKKIPYICGEIAAPGVSERRRRSQRAAPRPMAGPPHQRQHREESAY